MVSWCLGKTTPLVILEKVTVGEGDEDRGGRAMRGKGLSMEGLSGKNTPSLHPLPSLSYGIRSNLILPLLEVSVLVP